MKNKIILGWLLVFSYAAHSQDSQLADHTFSNYVSKKGEISLPKDFRINWSHLGSWLVADEKAPGYGFHDVYMQSEAAEQYRKTGKFADGSVLIKEIRHLESGVKTTGQATWAGGEKMWFVMIKDQQKRFNNKHWKKGWGWALFDTKNPAKNISESFEKTCQGCHLPVKDKDWVFTEGYPTLKTKKVM